MKFLLALVIAVGVLTYSGKRSRGSEAGNPSCSSTNRPDN